MTSPDTGGSDARSADAYQDLRPLMFAIAYRMLGSVSEAEDIVQEAFLRYHRALSQPPLAEAGEPDSPKAYLSAVTTRLCIDQVRSARARREAYVGEWLPEPLLTGPAAHLAPDQVGGTQIGAAQIGGAQIALDPADLAERADSLSMAFLLVLERLSPVERAVFLLHDIFSYGYDETAQIVGRTQDNCRQLARRARQHLSDHRPRYEPSRGKRAELAGRFFAAIDNGDMDGLVAMLAADVVVYGDSGGTPPSWPKPIAGRARAGRLLIGLGRQARSAGAVIRPAEINGQPGALFLDSDGGVISVVTLDIADGEIHDIADGEIHAVRSIISRDKLRHLGPLADIGALLRQVRHRAGPPGPPAR
jgi:RNA polymerase sigma-70 factor (ECF subfamily)